MSWISVKDSLPDKGEKVDFILDEAVFRGFFEGTTKFYGKENDPPLPCFIGDQKHINGSKATVTTLGATHWRKCSDL